MVSRILTTNQSSCTTRTIQHMKKNQESIAKADGAYRRLHVVICAASCHPDRGSEPGIGWQWVWQAARRHRVTVITGNAEGNFEAIEALLGKDKDLAEVLRFSFLPWFSPPPSRLQQCLWRLVPLMYYRHYHRWMKAAANEARRLVAVGDVDLIHQVTFATFREPGYMWNLGCPFVWGPIGGTQNVPWRFLPSLGFVEGGRHAVRNILNAVHWKVRLRVKRSMKRAAALSAVASDSQRLIKNCYGRDSVLIPATACSVSPKRVPRPIKSDGSIRFVFSGLHIGRKGLPFALRALAGLADLPWTLDVLGAGPLTKQWQRLAVRLGLAEKVRFRGSLRREEALEVVSTSDVLVHPSLQEGWPTVVVEALSLGLPVVTTNHHGMADMINEKCGFLARVDTPRNLIADLRSALRVIAEDPSLLRSLSEGACRRAEELSLERQESAISELYATALMGEAAK